MQTASTSCSPFFISGSCLVLSVHQNTESRQLLQVFLFKYIRQFSFCQFQRCCQKWVVTAPYEIFYSGIRGYFVYSTCPQVWIQDFLKWGSNQPKSVHFFLFYFFFFFFFFFFYILHDFYKFPNVTEIIWSNRGFKHPPHTHTHTPAHTQTPLCLLLVRSVDFFFSWSGSCRIQNY